MVDKVRPLKIESLVEGGSQTDYLPTETDSTQDYLSVKGLALEENDNFLLDKIGRVICLKEPYTTYLFNYLNNGEINYIEYFNSDTQIVANRIVRVDLTYNTNLDILNEVRKIYASDGTTILRTYAFTYSYTNGDISSTTMSIS